MSGKNTQHIFSFSESNTEKPNHSPLRNVKRSLQTRCLVRNGLKQGADWVITLTHHLHGGMNNQECPLIYKWRLSTSPIMVLISRWAKVYLCIDVHNRLPVTNPTTKETWKMTTYFGQKWSEICNTKSWIPLWVHAQFARGWSHPSPRIVYILTDLPARYVCHHLGFLFQKFVLFPNKPA